MALHTDTSGAGLSKINLATICDGRPITPRHDNGDTKPALPFQLRSTCAVVGTALADGCGAVPRVGEVGRYIGEREELVRDERGGRFGRNWRHKACRGGAGADGADGWKSAC